MITFLVVLQEMWQTERGGLLHDETFDPNV